ncbi:unnamed protein product [Acanthoscelides obtectus]|uniref:Uncharacterized protein n=1 Tax=Acanthoscelides obtectus TaxID=200917 RepID=A0A9P0P5N4_ACAOB|nr:unnamed protein product [Acanthoscelides obtectus]CAK1676495.1 hypothetical protein AOBTE_LOCUS30787 [Acanthoscelides obtectus]
MWEPFDPDQQYEDFGGISENCDATYRQEQTGSQVQEKKPQPWFYSIFDTVKRYKKEIFGEDSRTKIRKERLRDCSVPTNYKFVYARYPDNTYRPGSIVGRNKKLHIFIVYFYHNKRCLSVKPGDVILKHGNLLDRKVCFVHQGKVKTGTVFGNNSPANHGFPSKFFIRRRGEWFTISYKDVYITKKQMLPMYFMLPTEIKAEDNELEKNAPNQMFPG